MPLSNGERLGSYVILDPIRIGGMGEVYRGRDTRLGREVAIKILPHSFVTQPKRLEWFQRESRILGALNHPNILAIFDVGQQGDIFFLVTELLNGQTLRDCLRKGALPGKTAAEHSVQIARGLAAAHSKGIVHLDLKPDNIFITTDNQVKILDFGLARQAEKEAARKEPVASPDDTQTDQLLVGTPSYMSPELARGATPDARSDVFSFGVILYEMLFGRMAFKRDSVTETMTAVIHDEPVELATTHPHIPPGLENILRRCLEKTPERRFQCASDLALASETFADSWTSTSSQKANPLQTGLPGRIAVAATLVAFALAGILIATRFFKPPIPTFRQLIFGRGFIGSARFTPDGESVVYGAAFGGRPREMFLTRLDGQSSRHMGLPPADILGISRNGQMAISLHRRNYYNWMVTGTLGLAPLSGGAPHALLSDVCDADIASDGASLAIVRCGGTPQTLEYPIGKILFQSDGWISHPRISPNGDAVTFLEHPLLGDDRGYVSLVDVRGQSKRLTQEWAGVDGLAWRPSNGEIWFTSSLNAQPECLRAVNRSGQQRVILSTVSDLSLRDVSNNDRVLLVSVRDSTEVAIGRKNKKPDRVLDVADENAGINGISYDGKVAALVYSGTAGGQNYKTLVVSGEVSEPVLLGDGDPTGISADGKWILSVIPSNPSKLVFYPTDAGQSRTVDIDPVRLVTGVSSWSEDNTKVLFPGVEQGRSPRAYLLDRESGAVRAVTPEKTSDPIISPDGKFVLARNQSLTFTIYPVNGGTTEAVKGILNAEQPIQWDVFSDKVFVWDQALPAKVYRLDPKSGRRELWLEIAPDDVSGLLYGHIHITPDGHSYAYHFRRALTNLFLAENLR